MLAELRRYLMSPAVGPIGPAGGSSAISAGSIRRGTKRRARPAIKLVDPGVNRLK